MSIARITEISATSTQGFEDAIRQGVGRASKTLRNVRSAWVKEQQVKVENGGIVEYQVNLMITFVLDDQAYHYMQELQQAAYLRTTATILARLDYAALAHGLGVAYHEILATEQLDAGIRTALCHPGPVLVRDEHRRRSPAARG